MSDVQNFTITRRLEIDAAHRIPHHNSKCYTLHGHRYVIEATVTAGELIETGSQTGMVLDFGFLKTLMVEVIHDPCDHGILVWKHDELLVPLIEAQADNPKVRSPWKVLFLDDVPTAENLAKYWYHQLANSIVDEGYFDHCTLDKITVYETPNCKASYPW